MFRKLTTNIHIIFPLAALACDFLLFYVFMYMQVGFIWPKDLTMEGYWRENWLISLQIYTTLYFVYYTIQFFNKKYRDAPNSVARFIQELLVISLAGFFIQHAFRWIFIKLIVVPEENVHFLNLKLRMLLMVSMTFLLVLYALMTSFRIFRYLQQKQLELVKWQNEYAQSEFEGLKNQLNPHFLFNSLNILTSLVYADADKAETFIEKLSKTYRYLLEQKDKEEVPLKKEMEFFEGYKYLVEQRFGNKLQFSVAVDDSDLNKTLPPHAIMIALEYVIANNAMSAKNPLLIQLSVDKKILMIKYNSHPKPQIEGNSEKQLMTLKERYQLLSPKTPVEMTTGGDWGSIQYPLL